MSDHYKGIDEDGAYKSRHSASTQGQRDPRRSASSSSSQSRGDEGYIGARRTGSPVSAAQRARQHGETPSSSAQRPAPSQRPTSSAQRPAPSQRQTSSAQRPAPSQRPIASAQRPAPSQRPTSSASSQNLVSGEYARYERGGTSGTASRGQGYAARGSSFRVNISDQEYYDNDVTLQEIQQAQTSMPAVRQTESLRETASVISDGATASPRRIVTSSVGDTYQIQDDGVLAPRQLRSRQKFVRRKNRGCIVALVYAAVVCSISILLAYYLIVGVNDMFALNKEGTTDFEVDVPKGADLDQVTEILEQNNVIEYPFFFKTYAKISKKNTGFKAGTFTLNPKSDYNQLLQKLRLPAGADKSTITVTIPEGLTIEQVAVLMEDNSVCEAENFMKTAREGEFTQKFLSEVKTKDRPYKVEGYLFPDTYNFYLSEGSVSAVNRLLGEFGKHWTEEYAEKAKEIGMSMDEVVRLASVVEREASKSEDRYMVASVFENRLKNKNSGTGGKLQSDATRWYPYATKKELLASDKLTQAEKDDWINNNLGVCDTYRLKGLPPCPICSPSLDSIEAVLYHDKTSYLYFCSDAEGNFYFAKTLNEHNKNLKKAGLA